VTRVLLVDDHALVRRGVRQLLADEVPEVEVEEASTAAEAEQRLLAGGFDLAIVDLNLPDQSGLSLLTVAGTLANPPAILILSVYPESDFGLRCLRLGASGYLCKEGVAEELVAAVRKALAGGRTLSPGLAGRLAGDASDAPPPSPLELLSDRELQVLRLVSAGASLREIAVQLALSEKTVASYRARLAEKLGLSTNVALTRFALRHRLVD